MTSSHAVKINQFIFYDCFQDNTAEHYFYLLFILKKNYFYSLLISFL